MGRGVEYHHECDAVFHDAPWFLEHNVRLRDDTPMLTPLLDASRAADAPAPAYGPQGATGEDLAIVIHDAGRDQLLVEVDADKFHGSVPSVASLRDAS